MIIENLGKESFEIEGKVCEPNKKIEVSDEFDLSKIKTSFRVIGKKLKEPLKANLKE